MNALPRLSLSALHWSSEFIAPDGLLIQTACCYEQRSSVHLFDENKIPLLAALKLVSFPLKFSFS